MHADKSNKMGDIFKAETITQINHAMPVMHYHDFYEICVQDKGHRDLRCTNFHRLNPRDVVLIKPGSLHQSVSTESHMRSLVYFTDSFLQKYYSDEIINDFLSVFQYEHISLTPENYFQASKIIHSLSRETPDNPDNRIFIRLAELFMIFKKNIRENPPVSPQNFVIDSECSENESASPLIAYIHENYLKLSSIEEIASTFYMSPSHLCRTFKKMTSHTVIQYINTLKVRRACDLLLNTDKSVTEIAAECGFNSTMYFCKTYKTLLHLTPTEYRRTARKSI